MPENLDRSAPALMGDLIAQVTELIRKEIQLFRAEMNEKSIQAVAAIGAIVAGVVVALTALNVLAAAVVAALTNAGVSATWSAVIVGGVLAIIAFAMATKGITSLRASSLAPTHTMRASARDAEMVRERM